MGCIEPSLPLDLLLPACSAFSFIEGTGREMVPAVMLRAFLSSLCAEGVVVSNLHPAWCAYL